MCWFSFWSFMGERWSAVLSLFFCFSLSVCFFNKSLVLFLHSHLKRRKAFSHIAFSLMWSPFWQESFHISNNFCLLAICKEWKVGALKEEEKRFSEQQSAFQVLIRLVVCFGFRFFSLLYKQHWLTGGVYTSVSQRTEFELKIFTWPWNLKAECDSKALVLPKGLHWKTSI